MYVKESVFLELGKEKQILPGLINCNFVYSSSKMDFLQLAFWSDLSGINPFQRVVVTR